jgi:hypothetical protein
MKKLFCLLGVMVVLGFGIEMPLFAETIIHPSGIFEFNTPEGWPRVDEEQFIKITSPNGKATVAFEVLDTEKVKPVQKEIESILQGRFGTLEFTGTQEWEDNNLKWQIRDGYSKENDFEFSFYSAAAPSGKVFLMYYFGSSEVDEVVLGEIINVFFEIKLLKIP